jgi:hypothetical protein
MNPQITQMNADCRSEDDQAYEVIGTVMA